MGGAAFFGLALISGSKLVGAMAVVSVLSHFWFLSCVEKYALTAAYISDPAKVAFQPAYATSVRQGHAKRCWCDQDIQRRSEQVIAASTTAAAEGRPGLSRHIGEGAG